MWVTWHDIFEWSNVSWGSQGLSSALMDYCIFWVLRRPISQVLLFCNCFSFTVCLSHQGGCKWKAIWDICSGRDHRSPALHQVRKYLHWNVLGLHQRSPSQHWHQSHQSHRWRGTQVQRPHWEETWTQVSVQTMFCVAKERLTWCHLTLQNKMYFVVMLHYVKSENCPS